MNIIQKPSPNQDSNRTMVDRVVIHWMAGTLAAADAVFSKPNGTSAHYGIEDNLVHQYVEESRVAYHAGNYSMNQRSVGIEHSAQPGRDASEATYKTSGELLAGICKRHHIPLDRAHIIKHSQVVATQCPGTIDLDKLISIAQSFTNSAPPMNNDRRPYWFDRLNTVTFKTPHEKVTDTQVEKFVADYPGQQKRSGEYDKLCRAAGLSGDTNKIPAETVLAVLREQYSDETAIRKDERQKTISEVKRLIDGINR